MIIQKKIMQNIVDELEEATQRKINIMDETGCIVASSDKSRRNNVFLCEKTIL